MAIGALLALGPVFGLLGTAGWMARAFSLIGRPGITDPRDLSFAIHGVLLSGIVGVLLFPIGVVIFVSCLVMYLRGRGLDTNSSPRRLPD